MVARAYPRCPFTTAAPDFIIGSTLAPKDVLGLQRQCTASASELIPITQNRFVITLRALTLPDHRSKPPLFTNPTLQSRKLDDDLGNGDQNCGSDGTKWRPNLRFRGNERIEHALNLPQGSFRFKPRQQYSHHLVLVNEKIVRTLVLRGLRIDN